MLKERTKKRGIAVVKFGYHDVKADDPYCSICKNEPQGRIMTDYCPNCGAYMKGEKSNER